LELLLAIGVVGGRSKRRPYGRKVNGDKPETHGEFGDNSNGNFKFQM